MRLRDHESRSDGAEQARHTAEHDDDERIDDVELARAGVDRADHREHRAGDARQPRAEREGQRIDSMGVDADGRTHRAVLRHGAGAQTGARLEQDKIDAERDREREAEDEQPIQGQLDALCRLPGAGEPGGERNRHFLRAEDRAVGLLQDQAQAPSGEQRVERTVVEKADEAALEQVSEGEGDAKRDHDRGKQVPGHQRRQVSLEEVCRQVGRVGAECHQLAVRHVDDAHQAEHNRQPERHQQQDREQTQAVEDLHREDIEGHQRNPVRPAGGRCETKLPASQWNRHDAIRASGMGSARSIPIHRRCRTDHPTGRGPRAPSSRRGDSWHGCGSGPRARRT